MHKGPSPALALALAVLISRAPAAADLKMEPLQLPTHWGRSVTPATALPEYPPIAPKDRSTPTQYEGRILVPCPLESVLSGVQRVLAADQPLWFRSTCTVSADLQGPRTLLHFGAVNPFDVEGAQYGLMTYDRAVIKIPVAEITRLNGQLIPKAKNYAAATRFFPLWMRT